MEVNTSQSQGLIQNNSTSQENQLFELTMLILSNAFSVPIQKVLDAFKSNGAQTVATSQKSLIDSVSSWVPFTLNVPEGKDPSEVYVRVQGTDPNTGKSCYLSFDKQGNPTYHDVGDPDTKDPAAYCYKLSDLPKTINIPELTSGNMYFSVGKPLQGENPDRNNPSLPDYNTKWSMLEFTNNGSGIWADTTAVNSFGSPTLQMQMDSSQGEGPKIGYAGDPAEFISKVRDLINQYAGKGSEWDELFSSHDDINRINAPKFDPTFNHYYDDYLQNDFLPYYKTHDLYAMTSAGVLRGRVSEDGKTFNFYDKQGNLTASMPTTTNGSTRGWLTGALGDWPGGTGSVPVQADLARDLSALLSSGIKPSDTNTSWSQPITKEYFEAALKSGIMYQASYNGKPMYDLYERVMHEAGYNGYAYDYDDMLGRDGTQHADHSNQPSFNITINF